MNVDIVYEASWQLLSVDAGTRSCNSSHIRVLTRTVLCQLGKLETKVNPSQKPLLELEFLLRVCHQGGWLVDLCCGSGSGLIADLRLGYNVAGFDIKEAQVNAAKARIQKVSQQEDEAFKAYAQKQACDFSEPESDEEEAEVSDQSDVIAETP